jgi:hypothetical protein
MTVEKITIRPVDSAVHLSYNRPQDFNTLNHQRWVLHAIIPALVSFHRKQCNWPVSVQLNTAVRRLRMREFLSELSFELVQRLRKSIRLSAFIKL